MKTRLSQACNTQREFGVVRFIPLVLSGIIFSILIGSPTDVWSKEQILKVKASDPTSTISLLTAPHTGKKICDLQSSTTIKYFKRSDHGPHKYARVKVLEGACAEKQGYVSWFFLDPEPQEN